MALPVGQGALDLNSFQFTREDLDRVQPEGLQSTSIDTDLTRFQARGGKLMLYHGWADPLIPPRGTLDYYARLQDHMGARTQHVNSRVCSCSRVCSIAVAVARRQQGPI